MAWHGGFGAPLWPDDRGGGGKTTEKAQVSILLADPFTSISELVSPSFYSIKVAVDDIVNKGTGKRLRPGFLTYL